MLRMRRTGGARLAVFEASRAGQRAAAEEVRTQTQIFQHAQLPPGREELESQRLALAEVVRPLQPPDTLHLRAAQGWLELGNYLEADAELEEITPQLRTHPMVLAVRWEIYAAAKKWEAALDIAAALIQLDPEDPLGWIHRSYALHELKRTKIGRAHV